MQAGPGAENAFCRHHHRLFRFRPGSCFCRSATRAIRPRCSIFFVPFKPNAPVTKWIEEITLADQVPEIMRLRFYSSQDGTARTGARGNSPTMSQWRSFLRQRSIMRRSNAH
jgi:hypothetical protein